VAKSTSPSSGVALRYGKALFELARDADSLDPTRDDLEQIDRLFESSRDFARLVKSPVFSAAEQRRAVEAILSRAGTSPLVTNFIRVIIANRRLFALPEMIAAFRTLLAEHRGEVTAEIVSAQPLGEAEIGALRKAITERLGQDISLELHVDESLIGGLIVKVGSRMIDTSLKTKLNHLKLAMKEVR
jgi:F-type H+-transporting ATPase subunit delta